jgi:hypothetical protein
MRELQNFRGHFLDNKGRLYRFSLKRGFVQKKSFYKGSRLGFKLGQVFLSINQLKAEPVLSIPSYVLPF